MKPNRSGSGGQEYVDSWEIVKYRKSHHQFERSKTVAYKRNGFSNGRQLSTIDDSTQGKFETKKNFRSYSVHEKEINADFNDDLQAAIVSISQNSLMQRYYPQGTVPDKYIFGFASFAHLSI